MISALEALRDALYKCTTTTTTNRWRCWSTHFHDVIHIVHNVLELPQDACRLLEFDDVLKYAVKYASVVTLNGHGRLSDAEISCVAHVFVSSNVCCEYDVKSCFY